MLKRALPLILALCLGVSQAWASQATLVTPSAPLPMSGLASFLNSAFLSLGSCNSGNSAPANGTGGAAFAGECWINTTSNPWVFNYTDNGTNWAQFGSLNTTTHIWQSYSGGSPTAAPTQYAYPYGFSGCLTALCTNLQATGVSAGQVVPLLNGSNVWQSPGTIPELYISTSPITNGRSPSTIPSQTYNGATFCLQFTSAGIVGSPVTQCYTGTGTDTATTVAQNLCAAIIANTTLSAAATGLPIICDAGGAPNFNLQWSALINNVTVASTGTGTITLASASGSNNLDGIFWEWQRRITGYSLQAGDGVDCWIKYFNSAVMFQQCTKITSISGGVTAEQVFTPTIQGTPTQQFEIANGLVVDCASAPNPAFGGLGTLSVCGPIIPGNGVTNGIQFTTSGNVIDAYIAETAANSLAITAGANTNTILLRDSSANALETITGTGSTATGTVQMNGTLDATSTSSAGLTTAGGLGVAKQLRVAGAVTLGTPLGVANGGTGETGTAWTTFTPSLSCGSATFTVTSAKSKTIGKTTHAELDFTITAIGSCTTTATFTLPNTPNSSGALSGQEIVNNGRASACHFVSGSATATCGENAYLGGGTFSVNDRVILSGTYENQ
jgi:hypothetical protein